MLIHDSDEGQGYSFVWPEGIAGVFANDVISCLYKFLIHQEQLCFNHMLGGSVTLETVDRNVLIPGHTNTESDCDHTLVEESKVCLVRSLNRHMIWLK